MTTNEKIIEELARLDEAGLSEVVLDATERSNQMTTTMEQRITVNPQQCGGRPCVRGMRIRVGDVLDLLANNLTPDQIIEELPDLELADISACIRYASQRVSHAVVVP